MAELTKTMKLCLCTDDDADELFLETSERYTEACNYISQYIFDNGFPLKLKTLNEAVYHDVRRIFGLKSQMTQSAIKTVIARYKTVKEQLLKKPYRCKGEKDKTYSFKRDLSWLWYPINFKRPQIDLVRNRDYSFVQGKLSINTLQGRVKVGFHRPKCFEPYFTNNWTFGTAKLVSLKGKWYLHISVTAVVDDELDENHPAHIVGIDRGLRFIATAYDEKKQTRFVNGERILQKREHFKDVRAELQAKGTKSAKRALKRISGRENRWMSDVNHCLSKTLVQAYGSGTLFVLEDLTGVSFADKNLAYRSAEGRNELRSWSFYQLEEFLTYKAIEAGSAVVKVDPQYTSQRCPKCGRINKANRRHDIHEYVCDKCGYRSNDDRSAAMNIFALGVQYAAGVENPHYSIPATSKN